MAATVLPILLLLAASPAPSASFAAPPAVRASPAAGSLLPSALDPPSSLPPFPRTPGGPPRRSRGGGPLPASPPRYDASADRWLEAADASSDPDRGYGPVGSLLRFGPVPFVRRLSAPDDVEQAVLKYMAQERCGRTEAQGNMDAYFENPNDWALQKLEERKGTAAVRDYGASPEPAKVALTVAWGGLVTAALLWGAGEVASGRYCLEYPQAGMRFCRVFFAGGGGGGGMN